MRSSVTKITILLLALGTFAAFQAGKQIVRSGPDLQLPFSPGVKADGLIYLSGALAMDETGKLVGGDIKAQTRKVIKNLSVTLKAAGSSLANVTSVNVYLTRVSDFPAFNEVYRTYWSNNPPARTTVRSDLAIPGALIEISMVAVPDGAERRVIHPSDWIKSPNPYSYGVLTGETLFLAGLVSRNGKDNSVVSGDIKVQTKTVMENAGSILKAAGYSYGDVVSSRVYLRDIAQFQDFTATYRAFFPKDPPARATVAAELMGTQFDVEITLLAVKGASRKAFTTPNPDGSPGRANPNFSSAIKVGNRLYLAGFVGATSGTGTEIKAQTEETMARIERTLKAAGFNWQHIVDSVVYITDMKHYAGMNEIYRQSFQKDFPARMTAGVGLVGSTAQVEIMTIAIK